MKLQLNHTHSFGEYMPTIEQVDIERCPYLNGVAPRDAIADDSIPAAIRVVIKNLPWTNLRKYKWLYIRPQWCELGKDDKRSGNFWHLDVDAIYRTVAPDWDDFRALAVSFGDVSQTEFISEPMEIEVEDKPASHHYATLAHNFHGKSFQTHSPADKQVAHYTIRDVHRAGVIKRTGWRLIILGFETNAEPAAVWP